jgi:hypothetical protein
MHMLFNCLTVIQQSSNENRLTFLREMIIITNDQFEKTQEDKIERATSTPTYP